MKKTNKYILPVVAMIAISSPACAQLNNTVEVTNEIRPVVSDADKINVFPSALDTPAKHTEVEYQQQALPLTTFAPDPLRDYTSDAAYKGNKSGYAHLGLGSHGQIDAQAAYNLNITSNDALNLDLTLAGHNSKWHRNENAHRMYKNRLFGRYEHVFDNDMSVYLKGGFENHVFNYEHSLYMQFDDNWTDKQHNMLGGFAGGFTPWEVGNLTLSAEFGYKYFRQERVTNLNSGLKERILHGCVDGIYEFTDEHFAEVGIEMFKSGFSNAGVEGITHLHFTPHYLFKGDDFRLQAGIVAGTDGDIAPDLRFTYHTTSTSDLYVNVIGYDRDNDLRRFSAIHPYFAINSMAAYHHPTTTSKSYELDAEFHKLDANVGYRFSNVSVSTGGKLSGNVNVGYDVAENTPMIDWLTNVHNGLDLPLLRLCETKRAYANLDLTYAHRDFLKLGVKSQLNSWKYRDEGDEDWMKGNYIEPAFSVAWTADVKIIDGLYAGLTWEYKRYKNPDIEVLGGDTYERPALNNLGASLHYAIPASIPLSVFVKGDNLFNQKDTRYFNYRNIGANVLAGVAISF